MTQLTLPMPAQPLPPLAIDGQHQAERMAVLAEMAECRRDFAWDVGERRQAQRAATTSTSSRATTGVASAPCRCVP
jgi:hypothetical protein